MKKYNFNAGPSILSQEAVNNTIDAIREFAGTGLGLMEVSHRSKELQGEKMIAYPSLRGR